MISFNFLLQKSALSSFLHNNKVYSSFLYYNDTIQQRTFSIRQTENNFKNILKNFIPFKLTKILSLLIFIKYFKNILI